MMKKSIVFLFVLMLTAALYAETPNFYNITDKNGFIKASWTPFQLAVAPEEYGQLVTSKADVYGIALGILILEQESATLSVALTSGQHINYGLQCAGVGMSDLNYGLNVSAVVSFIGRNYGMQIGFVNVEADGFDRKENLQAGAPGLQIGGFNVGQGFQIGLLNYNTNAYVPVLPIFNFSK